MSNLVALVDSDTPIYSAALSAEDCDQPWIATSRLDRMIEGILLGAGCTEYKLFVSGDKNFRKEIDSNYKANRTQPSPRWREVCKEHLIEKWGAVEAHGCEADDYCGIYQNRDTIICGIDKDLLQIPGHHYQWEIIRKGEVVRAQSFIEISELDGYKNFYKQLLTGDASDNIKGIDGIGPKKAAKLIDHLESEDEMADVVWLEYILYGEDGKKRFYKNADLLWIMRELGVIYSERGLGVTYTLRGLNNE